MTDYAELRRVAEDAAAEPPGTFDILAPNEIFPAFIAAANPKAILALLDENERLQKRIATLEGLLREAAAQLRYVGHWATVERIDAALKGDE